MPEAKLSQTSHFSLVKFPKNPSRLEGHSGHWMYNMCQYSRSHHVTQPQQWVHAYTHSLAHKNSGVNHRSPM